MLSFWGPEAKGLEEEGLLPLMGPALAFTERYQCWICRGSLLGGPWVVSGGFRAHPHAFCFKSLGWGKVGREQSAGAPAGGLLAASGETGRPGLQLTILSLASESDGNPTTEDESSRSPEDLERGAAPVLAEAPAQGSIFLAGAAPPAPCPASSSILVNGSFLAAGSSPAVLLNGSPVIINSLALGEASSLGPLLLTGGSGAPPPPQPAPQGASEGKTSLVLDPQTGEVRLEEAQPNAEDAAETKEAQVAASGTAGEEAAGPLPQVVPGPPPAAPFPLPPGPVPSVASPQVVPLSPPPGYPAGLGPTSPLLNLPQVVPTSQVVTLPQAVGPLQLLAAGPGSPVKVAAAAGPANVHLINSGVGVTALQLPSATAPGTSRLAGA